jgi:quercetin dioxygenase-like cupin family protein
MTDFTLALYEHRLPPGGTLALLAANRVLYVVDGAVKLASAEAAAGLSANTAWCSPAALAIDSSGGAILLAWELRRADRDAPAAAGRLVLAAPIALDPAKNYLMRGDRVDFPVGGVAYKHRHQGPGIRRLLHGSMRVDTKGAQHDYAPGEAWFESGPDPVFAAASTTAESAFVRVMILPLALKGKSSISYVDDADSDKPKTQRYQVLIDFPIQLRVHPT